MVTVESALAILEKRRIEERRNEMAKNAKQSIKDYYAGKTKPINIAEIILRLDSL